MNLGTIIGLVVGMGLMGFAAWKGAGDFGVPITSLWDYTSILIVFGGSLAATAIAFKMSKVINLFKLLKMIFQDDNLFDHLSCRLNVAVGLRPSLSLSKDEWHAVDAAMDELGILAVQQRLPRAISGGQQQRVALARALIRAEWQNRKLLLFDEPFSALDPDTRVDCIDRVKHLVANNNMAALMVSHNQDDAIGLNATEIKLPLSPA